ncbi:MAG: glycosyltransferase family 2 protein [Acidobacteriota bacterium]|jgi:hypothetical protein
MADVERYVPNAVRLPPDIGVRRALREPEPRFGEAPFSRQELAAYDDSTIFYDVFLDHGNRRLLAIGPPLLNLRGACEPLSAHVRTAGGGTAGPLAYRERDCDGTCSIFEFDLPAEVTPDDGVSLSLQVGDVAQSEVTIPPSSSSPSRLTLGAIQKDNLPRWISDWARYHHDLGVDRLVLYDNGSERIDDVVEVLQDLPARLEVLLVAWDFKYGPARGWGNRFAQRGMLNHLASKWGNADWILNADVDEYVVVRRPGAHLPELLGEAGSRCAILRFRRYDCPILADGAVGDSGAFSVRDFPVRMRDPLDRFPKYLFRPAHVRCLTPHWGVPADGFISRDVEPGELCAFHYLGITTGWKDEMYRTAGGEKRRARRERFSPERHVVDEAVIERMARMDRDGPSDQPP